MTRTQLLAAIAIVPTLGVTTGTAMAADYLAMSGQDLYGRFCAACHGAQAHGDGPVASSFKIEVPDLTLLARRHGSKFSAELVERIIDGRQLLSAHGARNMPVWGEEFTRSEIGEPEAERATHTMIKKIAAYIVSIQIVSVQSREAKHDVP